MAARASIDDILGAASPLDRELTLTWFKDMRGLNSRRVRRSLRGIAREIQDTIVADKQWSPIYKLATFGEHRTEKGCLRNNENVQTVTGVEVDYDKEAISLDEAEATLTKAGLTALIYTSSSHSEGRPRWRVFLPFRREREPAERLEWVERVNWLFGGAIDQQASFTLSQAMYFGTTEDRPEPLTRLVEGRRFIDEADDIPRLEKGSQRSAEIRDESRSGRFWRACLDAVRRDIDYQDLLDELEDEDPELVDYAEEKRGTQGTKGDRTWAEAEKHVREEQSSVLSHFKDLGEPAEEEEGPSWWRQLDRGEAGAIKPTLPNIVLILKNDIRTASLIGYNEFFAEIVQCAPPEVTQAVAQLRGPVWKIRDKSNGDLWDDAKDNALREWMAKPKKLGGYGLNVTDRDLRAAVDRVADGNRFHPVRTFLNGLVWDGKPRMDAMLPRWLGCPDTPYHREVGRKLLLAAVTRAFEPGHKFDYAVIIEGKQGLRKSTWIKILAKNWFVELDCDIEDPKAVVETLRGSWIAEIPELGQFNKSDHNRLKAFFSKTEEKVRMSYARREQIFLRQSVSVGSTNDGEYLRDTTGNRRYWPVRAEIAQIDTDGFARVVDQIWAEAKTVYDEMRREQPAGTLPLTLEGDEALAEALIAQDERRIETEEDGLIGRILAWADGEPGANERFRDLNARDQAKKRRHKICGMQVWIECVGGSDESYLRSNQLRVNRALARLPGWKKGPREYFGKYGRQRVFTREVV